VRVACASLTLAIAAGCAPEIRWRGYVFDAVFADARRDSRLTFVYLRNWYMPECTEFENSVLNAPEVIEATADCYCAKLEYDWAQSYAQRWNVPKPPAVVILDPEGRVLERVVGPVDVPGLLEALQNAHAQLAAQTETAPARAAKPP
jgi:hypothetical protein